MLAIAPASADRPNSGAELTRLAPHLANRAASWRPCRAARSSMPRRTISQAAAISTPAPAARGRTCCAAATSINRWPWPRPARSRASPGSTGVSLPTPTTKATAARPWPTGWSMPKNVLTWRSIVNRVWHYHFGRGIVDTPNDLGQMGGPAVASRTARLAGRRISRLRRLAETAASADRDQRHLSSIVADRSARRRSSTPRTACCGG